MPGTRQEAYALGTCVLRDLPNGFRYRCKESRDDDELR